MINHTSIIVRYDLLYLGDSPFRHDFIIRGELRV